MTYCQSCRLCWKVVLNVELNCQRPLCSIFSPFEDVSLLSNVFPKRLKYNFNLYTMDMLRHHYM